MNWSRFFNYVPYRIAWNIKQLFRSKMQIDFLCGNIVDYICFQNIHELMPEVRVIARNKEIQKELQQYGVNAKRYPSFPDVIIMARHLARKYPDPKIKKIGMRHGAYHLKNFINKKKYNAFDQYFVTSKEEVKTAEKKGITSCRPIGFPKLDHAFHPGYYEDKIKQLKKNLSLDDNKKTIIFTATWDKKNYAAIDHWYHRLSEISDNYNVMVTVHPWTSAKKIEIIKDTKGINYINDKNIVPYLIIADLMVGDTSSILAEFCALDKPIITIKIPLSGRITKKTEQLLSAISYRVNNFEELLKKIPYALTHPNELQNNRKKYNEIMFDKLDGNASQRAVSAIKEII